MAKGDWERTRRSLEAQGYKLEQTELTRAHSTIVKKADLAINTEGIPLYLEVPAGEILLFPGIEDVEKIEEAGQLYVKFADSTNTEINDESPIRTYIETSRLQQIPCPGGSYGQFNRLAINEVKRPAKTIAVVGPNKLNFKVTPRGYAIESDYTECTIAGYVATPTPRAGDVIS